MLDVKLNLLRPGISELLGMLLILLAVTPLSAQEADLVLRGGKVVTVDGSNTIAEAVAVVGNRIAAVGSNESIETHIGSDTLIVELNGKTLLPGFIDAHGHLAFFARTPFRSGCSRQRNDTRPVALAVHPAPSTAPAGAEVPPKTLRAGRRGWHTGGGRPVSRTR